jgi:superfamily II DNA or RNA helicase
MTLLEQSTGIVTCQMPVQYGLLGRAAGNLVKQVIAPSVAIEALVSLHSSKAGDYHIIERSDGSRVVVSERKIAPPKGCGAAIRIATPTTLQALNEALRQPSTRWGDPRPKRPEVMSVQEVESSISAIRTSWRDALEIREERHDDETLQRPGLRSPQVGAIHAVKAHWVVSEAPATVVMPTGTGKTETMLALLVVEDVKCLLVLVPTDALREQVSNKFATLGELKRVECLKPDALYPIVVVMKRSPRSSTDVEAIFGRAQVIVATMASLSKMPPEIQSEVASKVTHLFVDEAHHIAAKTWRSLKQRFVEKKRRIIQFTATPYRNDERRIDGKFIFVYPLRLAQEQKLFRPVHFEAVMASRQTSADIEIIQKVGAALKRDQAHGFNHLVMARADGIDRATKLLALYRELLPQHSTALLNSQMKHSERIEAIEHLRSGRIRIIVCVNMLGEGFDLPQLKIAALHDAHRSEAVTFQFIGRFTRNFPGIGDATVIAKVSLEDPHRLINALYREDADWNKLLRIGGAIKVESERRREEFFGSIDVYSDEIPLDSVTPKLSAYVFRTQCARWAPEKLIGLETRSTLVIENPVASEQFGFAMVVVRIEDRLRWVRVKHPADITYNLVMAHWDQERSLLYVHSSSTDGIALEAAKLIAGEDVIPLKGEAVFRVLHGFRQVMLSSLGVRETQAKPIRFQLSNGINIIEELEAAVGNRSKIKTNLSGSGYVEETVRTGEGEETQQSVKRIIGCSTKGKIWSPAAARNILEWMDWCHTIGPKIADDSITTEAVLKNILRPHRQNVLPSNQIPLSVDWPEGFYNSNEDRVQIVFGEVAVAWTECDITIAAYVAGGPIRFRVASEEHGADFEMDIRDGVAVFVRTGTAPTLVRRGKRDRDILEVFQEDHPIFRLAEGATLIGADLAEALPDLEGMFDHNLIVAIDWKGVDIKKESQGPNRKAGTVQHYVIAKLINSDPPYDLIFDGDGAGEVADVIAVRRQGNVLDVELYHCKFSGEPDPSARVDDLYEVCGQSMKSVRWADPRSTFLKRMREQEENRRRRGGQTRFQLGSPSTLNDWIADRREMTTRFSVTIVQPGYSLKKANPKHIPLLGSVRSYLMQTYKIGFGVWASH